MRKIAKGLVVIGVVFLGLVALGTIILSSDESYASITVTSLSLILPPPTTLTPLLAVEALALLAIL